MAETKKDQKSNYPLPAYNFKVTIDGTAISFSDVSGLNVEYEKITYRHGFSYWEGESINKFYIDKYISITLKKGMVQGIDFLYQWLKDKETRNVEVSLCGEEGQPVISWKIAKALPVKLEAPSFNADTNDVSIESLEVMAAGISIEHH